MHAATLTRNSFPHNYRVLTARLIFQWWKQISAVPLSTPWMWKNSSRYEEECMKLMIIIVQDSDGDAAVQTLVEKGYHITRMASTGGFLRRGNVTLLAGVENDQVKPVMSMLRRVCTSTEEGHHRATIFVVNLSSFEQI